MRLTNDFSAALSVNRIMEAQGTQAHFIAQMRMELDVARNRINALDEQNHKESEELAAMRNQNMGNQPTQGVTSQDSGFIPVPLLTSNGINLNDPVARRLKQLQEQNEKMLSLLAKLPGATVPVDVEPRTGFQASPFGNEIAMVDVPKKYNIPTFSPKNSGSDPIENITQYK
ncbi:hypothetical protein L6452_09003 [Arctium lappa]|uniref:Uncharacterized protein n=1 Tax=Arctium lappa TaxID=4217 RepID=A0ACB9DIV2_ARCLA|nr:hypothetical protein L6452_09003 [Arctium lappa]